MPETCPGFIHIKEIRQEGGNERSVDLLPDKKISDLNGIYANNPLPVSIKLLNCHNVKHLEYNYCSRLQVVNAVKRICDTQKNEHVFFYIRHDTIEYLLAFVKYSDYDSKKGEVQNEVYATADWLGINAEIQCYIFLYQRPICYDTSNIKRRYSEINKKKKPRFTFYLDSVPMKKNRQILYINGGYPCFTFKVQDVDSLL
jgi:hypothetical protein